MNNEEIDPKNLKGLNQKRDPFNSELIPPCCDVTAESNRDFK